MSYYLLFKSAKSSGIGAAMRMRAQACRSRRMLSAVTATTMPMCVTSKGGTQYCLHQAKNLTAGQRISLRCFHDSQRVNNNNNNEKPDLSEGNNNNDKPDLSEGTQHIAQVRRVVDFGAFVRIKGSDTDALLHVSEISDHYVSDPAHHLREGQLVEVAVLPPMNNKLRVTTRASKIRKVLSDDFQPCTVVVFDLPMEMDEEEISSLFSAHGHVLDVNLLPMPSGEFKDHLRQLTFVTFEEKDKAEECIRRQHGTMLPLQIGRETYYYRIGVRMAREQNYKAKMQAELDEQYRRAQEESNPEYRRAKRMARRALRDLIPEAGDYFQ